MPIRNIWSLKPGECVTAEEIKKKAECEVFFPLWDVGVDLLVVKGQKHVGIQVKESRYHRSRTWPSGHFGHSWHQVPEKKFLRDKDKVDFYVFVTYVDVPIGHKMDFQNRFVVVPGAELEKRMKIKDPGKNEMYSFCFHFEGEEVWDKGVTVGLENELTNYSEYLDAWHLIRQALESTSFPE